MLLPKHEWAEIERLQRSFSQSDEFVVAHIEGLRDKTRKLTSAELISKLEAISEVTAAAFTGDLVLIQFTAQRLDLDRSRAVNDAIRAAFEKMGLAPDLIGSTFLRVAAWDSSQRDLQRTFLPLLIVITVLPLLMFRHWSAALLPLLLSSTTSVLTLGAMRFFDGSLSAIAVFVVPFIFAVATLDAVHLLRAVHRAQSSRLRRHLIVRALRAPCVATSATTIAGLLSLTLWSDVPLLQQFALWCSLATIIAFALTFTLGTALLSLTPASDDARVHTIVRFAPGLVSWSLVQSRKIIACWFCIALASFFAVMQINVSPYFPNLFSSTTPTQIELNAFIDATQTVPAPIDTYIQSDTPDKSGALLQSLIDTTRYVGNFDESRYVLPRDFSFEDASTQTLSHDDVDRLASKWIDFDKGVARVQLFLQPTSQARKNQLFDWLRHFDETFLDGHSIALSGAGYFYNAIESRAVSSLAQTVISTLMLILILFYWRLQNLGAALVACSGVAIPLVAIALLLWFGRGQWSLLLLPVPAIVIGLAIDDAIHLLWRAKNRIEMIDSVLAKSAQRTGPALLGTTAILSISFATVLGSDVRANHDIAWLLCASMPIALLCNLTLLPALFTFFARR